MLEEEKKVEQPQDKRAQARAALTDLFQSIKTDETPIVVENVVNDIDNEVVNIVRQFNDAFKSITAITVHLAINPLKKSVTAKAKTASVSLTTKTVWILTRT